MREGIDSQVISVAQYELTKPREDYAGAIQALARRTRDEGHPGVLAYQFYTADDEDEAGAVIIYADADA